MTTSQIRFGLLGPLDVRVDEVSVPVPLRVRVLLAALLCRPHLSLGVDELADIVWEDAPPAAATATLRSHVLRLRRLLGPAAGQIETTASGYRFSPDDTTELDTAIFAEECERARVAARLDDWPAVSRAAYAALALWRGAPLADVPADRLHREEVPGWNRARAEAAELAARADLRLGRNAEALRLLQRMVTEAPYQEDVHCLLMEALAAVGRRAEALAVYRRLRSALVGGLGIEPGAQAMAVHERLLSAPDDRRVRMNRLQGDPAGVAGPRQPGAPTAVPAATAAPVHTPAPSPAAGAVVTARPGTSGPAPAADDGIGVLRQLPAELPTFTGRARELAALVDPHLEPAPRASAVVVTVIEGMAGIGKTSLAVRAAHELVRAGRFRDLQLYVNLRGFEPGRAPADPCEVLGGLLCVLGVEAAQIPEGVDARAALFRHRLHDREALIILDDAAEEGQIRPLIPAGTGCLVLVTGRRNLAGLDGAALLPLTALARTQATELLAAILGPARVAAEPDAAACVAELCGRLPLALALAAARLRTRPSWSLADLAGYVEAGGISAISVGDRSLGAAFQQSYEGLPVPIRRLFRVLGVHPGRDYTAHSAAMMADIEVAEARIALEALVDENLLSQTAPGRYRLPDLLHAFAFGLAAEFGTGAFAAVEPVSTPRANTSRELVPWWTSIPSAATALSRIRLPPLATRSQTLEG